MVEIPEEQHAQALRRVAAAAELRDRAEALVARLTQRVERASVEAAQVGTNRSRIREVAGVSPRTMYGWFADAGLEIRPKRPAKKPRT
ncbi:hypothetical protein [Kitasatospora sp. NPDC006786]|uniref:hypothetical protein n=1 Tax=unclassified Kitasatospora TaxID=2633591 RepID=UPI0033DD8803